ncbi:MAG TPA: pantetheine-phosphate adenylyltransferase [Candidatus Binatia bacterium]|nr:pantetheine-phosphate adenylyltransferase [Candidatus Binatia bacterium]
MKRRAIYPGSFDPPTYGHIDIIRRSLQIVDEVVVAIVYNPQKDSFLFSPQERIDMFREELTEVGDRVLYDSFHGLLVDYVDQQQATIIIRGLRAVSDFDYEFQMALMNRRMKPHIETIFLMTGAAHFYTAARLVKEIASFDGNVDGLVPPHVVRRLKEKFAKK